MIELRATVADYRTAVKLPSAPANVSLSLRTRAYLWMSESQTIAEFLLCMSTICFGLGLSALLYAFRASRLIVPALIFVVIAAHLVSMHMRRTFRQAQARRARIAEACGCDLGDAEDVARVGVAFRGRDLR